MLDVEVGFNVDASRIDGQYSLLEKELEDIASRGASLAEISPHGCGVINNGQLNRYTLEKVMKILNRFDLKYTVHGPNPMNLMDDCDEDTHYRMFVSSIDFAAAVKSKILVYHAGRMLPEERFLMVRGRYNPSRIEDRRNLERQEAMALASLADYAQSQGVVIAVENARPYLDASPYSYGEHPREMEKMLELVNHPAVGITLDTGHLYLSSVFYGFDMMENLRRIAPYVRHIHMHDNFGKTAASYESKQYELQAAGRGDLHLPPGMGCIPLNDILMVLENYSGALIIEMRPRFNQYRDSALQYVRELVDGMGPELQQRICRAG